MADHVATAKAEIDAPEEKVWDALTDPDQIKEYMFGSSVSTDWRPGSPIVWKGEYQGKTYEDKGEIIEIERPRLLKLTHFSPSSGLDDRPENYHTLVYELEEREGKTHLSLSQDTTPPRRRPTSPAPTGRRCSRPSSRSSNGARPRPWRRAWRRASAVRGYAFAVSRARFVSSTIFCATCVGTCS